VNVKGCSRRWTDAQEAEGERADAFGPCRGCAMGAALAGREAVSYSGIYGKQICPRCGKGTTRMIGGSRCVSCYNREAEMRKGRKACGNLPTTLMRDRNYRKVSFRLIVEGMPRRITAPSAASTMEPVLRSMRTVKGDLAFAYAGPPTRGLPRLWLQLRCLGHLPSMGRGRRSSPQGREILLRRLL
jgi:hypothetical protein